MARRQRPLCIRAGQLMQLTGTGPIAAIVSRRDQARGPKCAGPQRLVDSGRSVDPGDDWDVEALGDFFGTVAA